MNAQSTFKSPGTLVRILGALAFGVASSALLTFSTDADARGERVGRGDGIAAGSVSGVNRSNISAGNGSRSTVNTGGNRSTVNSNRNRSNVNTGTVNTGNVTNIQGGDRNTSINIDRDIDVDGYHGGYYGGHHDHYPYPVAAGAVIGAVAVTTAAVVGSYYYALPPTGCAVVIINGISYQRCGSVYYQQTWQGDKAVYVVVKP
ncbi:MAG: hypothetical protein KDI37_13625 [Xanthomonadales bacterium]|nr:hypothetical protein [Xanthomonadales bacterium]